MPVRQRTVLIAAGAGGGIAATFNTPIGGIAFAVELMLPFATAPTLLVVALSTVVATYIGRFYFGALPSFNVPSLSLIEGAASSVSPALVRAVRRARRPLGPGAHPWHLLVRGSLQLPARQLRHMSGMLLVGLVMYGFMTLSAPWFGQPNHYYVQGVGYATIMDVLRGDLTAWHFLLLLVAAKLLLTCLTLGSGASGGVFSPSIFLGATLGGAFGTVLLNFVPNLPMTPAHFAYARPRGGAWLIWRRASRCETRWP